jgi:integrase/recombinase XerD
MKHITRGQLTKSISEFLTFKRAMGYSYRNGEFVLRNLERFTCAGKGPRFRVDLEAEIPAWLLRNPARKPISLAADLAIIRQFCLFTRRTDETMFVPSVSMAPRNVSRYVAHIFSLEEIRQLIHAAEQDNGRRLSPGMLRMLLIATYCTGLRLGEAVRLQLSDLDMKHHVLHIRDSKGRTRDVPFQDDLAREFAKYLRERSALLDAHKHKIATALFLGRDGRAIGLNATSIAIRRLLRRIGLKGPTGRSGPRPYDLRHAYAVHRLTAWYRDGLDLNAQLPWLSAYMGHVNLLGTEVYLHATPELLEFASNRFARYLEAA